MTQLRDDVVTVEPLERETPFCEDCGYAMSVHPTPDCPDETAARETWGDDR